MISINDMLGYGIVLQGPVSVVIFDNDANDRNELFQGDAQGLSSMHNEDWMKRDIAYIYPSSYSHGYCIELESE